MDTAVVLVLVTVIFANVHGSWVKIYEIRKSRDESKHIDDHNNNLNEQYATQIRDKPIKRFDILANDIIKRLQRLSKRNDDDYDYEEQEPTFIDETRSLPVVIISEDENTYNKDYESNKLVREILRSAHRDDLIDVEERTAPPRHLDLYEYEY